MSEHPERPAFDPGAGQPPAPWSERGLPVGEMPTRHEPTQVLDTQPVPPPPGPAAPAIPPPVYPPPGPYLSPPSGATYGPGYAAAPPSAAPMPSAFPQPLQPGPPAPVASAAPVASGAPAPQPRRIGPRQVVQTSRHGRSPLRSGQARVTRTAHFLKSISFEIGQVASSVTLLMNTDSSNQGT